MSCIPGFETGPHDSPSVMHDELLDMSQPFPYGQAQKVPVRVVLGHQDQQCFICDTPQGLQLGT